MVYFFRKLNDSLSIAVSRYNNAFVLDIDEIVGSFGRRYFQPDVLVQTTHSGWLPDCDVYDQNRLHPIHRIDEHYPLQGEPIMDAMVDEMLAMRRTIEQIDTVKLVVLDLDDTLWRGVLVEEEEFYSYTTEGWPLGLAEALLFLKKRGVLLALVSKNDEAKIVSLWDKVWGGKLLLEDFAVRKINWESKADNIDEVMREVNVLPPSVVFIDDNPVERAAVQAAFPDIRVLGSEPYVVRRILLWSPETQVAVITEESSRRTEMVHSQVERESARKRFSKEEFLASLNVKNDSFRNLRSQPSEISPRGGAAE
jgi:HAD superfamily phosphatase (TIGR01681 family)